MFDIFEKDFEVILMIFILKVGNLYQFIYGKESYL